MVSGGFDIAGGDFGSLEQKVNDYCYNADLSEEYQKNRCEEAMTMLVNDHERGFYHTCSVGHYYDKYLKQDINEFSCQKLERRQWGIGIFSFSLPKTTDFPSGPIME